MVARIEQYEQRVGTPSGTVSGGKENIGLPNFRLDFENIGQGIENLARARQQADANNARAEVAAIEPEAQLAIRNEFNRVSREWQPGQAPIADQMNQFISTYSDTLEGRITSDFGRELIRDRSNTLRAQYMLAGADHQLGIETDVRIGQYGRGYEAIASLAATDPLKAGPELARMNAAVMADDMIPLARRQSIVQESSRSTALSVARVQAEANPKLTLGITSALLGISEPTVKVKGNIVDALVRNESGGRMYAESGEVLRGPAIKTRDGRTIHAYGKYQLLEDTAQEQARRLGIPWDRALFLRGRTGDAAKDAETAAYHDQLGRAYIADQQREFGGNPILIAAAHNMGPEATRGWAAGRPYQTQSGKWWHPSKPMDMAAMPEETREYIGRLGDIQDAPPAPPRGMVEPGNIDLGARPVVDNGDGSFSTVRSISIGDGGKEVLIPTVSDDGQLLSDEAAIQLYRATGRHLGKFESAKDATAYAESLHENQAEQYAGAMASRGEEGQVYRLLTPEDLLAVRSAAQSRMSELNRQEQDKFAVSQALFKQRLDDIEVAAKAGDPVQIPGMDEMVTFLGPADALLRTRKLAGYQAMAAGLQQLPSLSNAELTGVSRMPNPEGTEDRENRQFVRDALADKAKEILALRTSDPGQAALQSSQEVKTAYAAWQQAAGQYNQDPANQTREQFDAVNAAQARYVTASFTQQRQWGIVEPKLPQEVVTAMSRGFVAGLDGANPGDAVARYAALPKQLGSYEAIRQVGDKTGDTGWFAMEGVPADVVLQIRQARKVNPAEAQKLIPNDIKVADIRTAVQKSFAPLLASLGTAGIDQTSDNESATRYFNGGITLATQYLINGQASNAKRAAEMAYEALYASRETIINGVRIPNSFDADAVMVGMQRRLQTLDPQNLYLRAPSPGLTELKTKQRILRNIQQNGRWVTNEVGDGAYLMVAGKPALDAAQRPIEIKFQAAQNERNPLESAQQVQSDRAQRAWGGRGW